MYNCDVKKITITGSSGVGKTTLSKQIAQELDLPLIEETARVLCAEMGFARIGDIPEQEKFKHDVLIKQIESESKHESFVADRSAIDCWILWQRWNICTAMTFDTETLYTRVAAHADCYTHIIYIPPLFAPEDDGFRWVEPDYVKQIDRITRMTLYDLNLWGKTLTISKNTLEERISEVRNWLDS